MSDKERPKQFAIDEKTDRIIDLGLRRTVYGTLAGAAVGVVLFRTASTRAAVAGFGAGFGAGSAYADSQKEVQELLAKPS